MKLWGLASDGSGPWVGALVRCRRPMEAGPSGPWSAQGPDPAELILLARVASTDVVETYQRGAGGWRHQPGCRPFEAPSNGSQHAGHWSTQQEVSTTLRGETGGPREPLRRSVSPAPPPRDEDPIAAGGGQGAALRRRRRGRHTSEPRP